MEEIWRDICGYEGMYMVSNLGRVKSIERMIPYKRGNSDSTRYIKEGVLSICVGKRGYCVVKLGRKSPTMTIHRLVAQSFIPNPENKPCVNHIDGNKLNNNVDNIEWCTYRENNIHAINMGLLDPAYWKGKFGKQNHRSKPVNQYSKNGEYIQTFESVSDAVKAMKLKSNSSIAMCANHRKHQLTAGGYKWEYVS